MDRRDFLQAAATGAASLGTAATPAAARSTSVAKSGPPARMKVGHQHTTAEPVLKALSAFGVKNICSEVPSRKFDENWSVEGLTRLRERVESHGISLDAVPLPLSAAYMTRAENPHIMLGKEPERGQEIDLICQMIRNAARAGIPMLKYNMTLLGVVRTKPTPGRGASTYSTFVYDQDPQDPPLTEAGPVSEEMMWERITYFLKRVIPVAEECKVKLACHPHDPGMPKGKGHRGIHRVLGSVDGLKRFVQIVDSPYHGLNFCQGTVSEMLEHPARDIYEVIRYFGSRGKIFNVHFRNIKGGFLNFQETFPDDGDVDMIRAMRTYKEVGYSGMIMPDHAPKIDGDTGGAQAFAFAFGYIQALIQLVKSES